MQGEGKGGGRGWQGERKGKRGEEEEGGGWGRKGRREKDEEDGGERKGEAQIYIFFISNNTILSQMYQTLLSLFYLKPNQKILLNGFAKWAPNIFLI